MTNDAQDGKQPPRLNPFAFPADTDFRFVLLIALVLGSSLYIYYQLSSSIFGQQLTLASQCKPGVSFTDCAAPYIRAVVWWLIGGVMLEEYTCSYPCGSSGGISLYPSQLRMHRRW